MPALRHAVTRAMAGVELEPGMARAIDRGDAGRAVVAGLEDGSSALFTEIAQLAVSGDADAHLPALTTGRRPKNSTSEFEAEDAD